MQSLRIHLFGHTSVVVNGGDVTSQMRPKSLALLMAMAGSGRRRVPREWLAEVLWPDSEPAAAYLSLKVAVHNLRRSLDSAGGDAARWLRAEHGFYRLDDCIWIDVEQFGRAVRVGSAAEASGQVADARRAFREAVELYRGDYLEDELYKDWTMLTRELLRDQFLYVLDRLLRAELSEGNHAFALQHAHRIVEIDPCREDVYRLLMLAHAALGQFSRAMAWYQVAREVMRRELDADVSTETKAVFRHVTQARTAGNGVGSSPLRPKVGAARTQPLPDSNG